MAGPVWADGPAQATLAYQRAAAYSDRLDGLAVIVARGDEIVFEHYAGGAGPGEALPLASGTKSFWCAAYAAGVADGLFTGETRVSETLTEWQSDPQKRNVTVRQLLNYTSGLDNGFRELRQGRREDIYALTLDVPTITAPGAEFTYGPSHVTVFGAFLKRRLGGESPLAYLERRVLAPIGLQVGRWRTDRSGNPGMSAGAFLTARDWLKYGQLLAGEGVWQGRRILAAEPLRDCREGSAANPMFGLTFWLNAAPDPRIAARQNSPMRATEVVEGYIAPRAPRDMFMALGAGNQRLYIIPSLDLAIVRYGKRNRNWSDAAFLDALLN